MKKVLFYSAALALLIAGSCDKNSMEEPEAAAPRTFTVSAAFPADGGQETSVSLTPDAATTVSHGIKLAWEPGDELLLCFQYGTNYYHTKAPILGSTISTDGHRADFTVTVPNEIPPGTTFNLYAVYQKPNVINTGWSGKFQDGTGDYRLYIREERGVTTYYSNGNDDGTTRPLLFFSQENIANTATPAFAKMAFRHTGWMLAIHFKNNTAAEMYLPARLSLNSDEGWTWDKGNDGRTYFDCVNGSFKRESGKATELSLNVNGNEVAPLLNQKMAAGEERVFYRWAASDASLPELALYVNIIANTSAVRTPTNLRARTVENGKVYHIYVKWDGINLTWGK